jgi:hypothetical protein
MMGTNGGAGLKGIVQNILFMGSYYSIEVNTGRQLVKINTAKQTCKKGDSIEITVTTGDAPWYIND